MKLLFCWICHSVIGIPKNPIKCKCGSVKGMYLNNLDAIYTSDNDDAMPLGFNSSSFVKAIRSQPDSGMGRQFTAFVIPKECPTFTKVTPEEFMSKVKELGRSEELLK